jgi:hypothetical protein
MITLWLVLIIAGVFCVLAAVAIIEGQKHDD